MEKKIIIHNPNGLPIVSYKKLVDFQGKLKEVSKENIEKIIKSILNNGIFVPKFVWLNDNKYYIIDGHTTKLALGELEKRGYNIPEIPYVEIKAENRSEAKKKLLVINSHYGRMTDEGLYEFLETDGLKIDDLKDEIDFSDINMDKFMDNFYNDKESDDDDDIPEEVDPITKRGDIIELGRHRLLCGNSEIDAEVDELMDKNIIDLLLTDPPYGINIIKKNKIGGGGPVGGNKNFKKTIGGENIVKSNIYFPMIGDDKPFDPSFLLKYKFNKIIFGANYYANKLPESRGWFCWDKLDGLEGTTKNFSDIEIGWTDFNTPARLFRHRWHGLMKGSEKKNKRKHPTQKPIQLFIDLIFYYKNDSKIILDLFLGSGSTLIACDRMNKICYGMEIDEHNCDIIIERYRQYCITNNLKRVIRRNGEELKF